MQNAYLKFWLLDVIFYLRIIDTCNRFWDTWYILFTQKTNLATFNFNDMDYISWPVEPSLLMTEYQCDIAYTRL